MAAQAYLDGERTVRAIAVPLAWLVALCGVALVVALVQPRYGIGLYPILPLRHFVVAAVVVAVMFGPRPADGACQRMVAGALVRGREHLYGLYVLHMPLLVDWQRAKGQGALRWRRCCDWARVGCGALASTSAAAGAVALKARDKRGRCRYARRLSNPSARNKRKRVHIMKLNELRDNQGARKSKIRVGRGIGSGKARPAAAASRVRRAAKASASPASRAVQMPLHMRLPKRGFNNIFAKDYATVNTGAIQKAIDSGKLSAEGTIDQAALKAAGLVRGGKDGVRVLGKGDLTAKLSFHVAGVSAGAREMIEKAVARSTSRRSSRRRRRPLPRRASPTRPARKRRRRSRRKPLSSHPSSCRACPASIGPLATLRRANDPGPTTPGDEGMRNEVRRD